ncbi:MAG: hypothetical protein KAU95_00490, partial [Candidatus Aenigmarchaeota archaeon]|nr:hypothetical protein [Candidatus Aenigmarchaeota archaeon]
VEYLFNKDSTYYLLEEDRCISNIVRAKEAGFAVLVSPNFVSAGGHNFERRGIVMTKERYLKISEEIALKWAGIAEELNVEFFAPQNELDGVIKVNFARNNSEVAEITSVWHEQMLPKLKKVFNGKLMIKLTGVKEEYKTINAGGYDYIGITLFHRNKGLVAFREDVREQYSIIADISERNNISWLVSEAWFPYGKKIFYPVETNEDGESLNELQDEYYDISIQEYSEFAGNKPSGYIFCAWLMPGLDVKERTAANSLKAFFNRI